MTTMNLRMVNGYRLGCKYSTGSSNDVYQGTNTVSGETVAIKLESLKAEYPRLENEARIYESLAGGVGIPWVRWFGTNCDYNVMVLDLLGPDLEALFQYCDRKFSLKTVLLIADQLISRIEYIHAKFFIYRDIKPDSFLIGVGKMGAQINVIGLGFAKEYGDSKAHSQIPQHGTAQCSSFNTHSRFDQSRRDDIESLGYLMLYFYRSILPWHEFLSVKKKTPIESLCRGSPDEFAIYLNYARSLKMNDKPDYSYLRRIFRDLFLREGYEYDGVFDWTVHKDQRQGDAQPLNFPHTPPETISPEELRRFFHSFTEELSKLEAKCGDRHKELSAVRQTSNPAKRLDLSASEWWSFRELHQRLLDTYHEFFKSSHHPSATEDLRNIAQHDDIPDKLLKLGVLSFLDIARCQLSESLEHMLTHINYPYRLLQTLVEGASVYRGVWLEGTRQLAWYTMSLQVIDCDRHCESKIFQYRNAAAVTQRPPLLNVSKDPPYTLMIETLQPSTQTRDGDRLKLLPNEILGEIFSQLPKKDLLGCRFLGRHYRIVIESLRLYQQIWQWQIRLCVLTWKDCEILSETREWEPELVKLARRGIGLLGWKILLAMVDRKRASVNILQKNLELSVQKLE